MTIEIHSQILSISAPCDEIARLSIMILFFLL